MRYIILFILIGIMIFYSLKTLSKLDNIRDIVDRVIEQRKIELQQIITEKDITYHGRIEELDFVRKELSRNL